MTSPSGDHIYVFSVPLTLGLGMIMIGMYDLMKELRRSKRMSARASFDIVLMIAAQALIFTYV